MNQTLPELVWDKILTDPEFADQPETVKDAMRPFFMAAPVVLIDLLDLPVTLANLMTAKLMFLQYCLENDYIRTVVDATPEEALGLFGPTEVIALLESALCGLIQQLSELTNPEAVAELLAIQGITEEEVMLGPKVNFAPSTAVLYQNGELTIRRLLIEQPMVIVKNTD